MDIENENLKQDKGWLIKILSLVTTIGLTISSYFLTATVNKLDVLDKRIYAIEIGDAKTTGTYFSNNDWYIQKALMDADRFQTEKRLTALEHNMASIKESLLKIESLIEKQFNK